MPLNHQTDSKSCGRQRETPKLLNRGLWVHAPNCAWPRSLLGLPHVCSRGPPGLPFNHRHIAQLIFAPPKDQQCMHRSMHDTYSTVPAKSLLSRAQQAEYGCFSPYPAICSSLPATGVFRRRACPQCLPLQVCVAGWSMGGIHACMVTAFSRYPVACAAMLPPRSAAAAYSDGALSEFVHFPSLRTARDATGAPVLPAVLRMLRPQPPYPNTPILMEPGAPERPSVAHAGEPGGRADVHGGAAGGGWAADAASLEGGVGAGGMHAMAGLHVARHLPEGSTVMDMFREQGDLGAYGPVGGGDGWLDRVSAESAFPLIDTPHSAHFGLSP